MHVSILGGGGFLGRKVAQRLAAEGTLGGKPVQSLTLFDLAPPPKPEGASFPVHALGGDARPSARDRDPPETNVVFHLAAVVSAAAEADYELGRQVNVRGTDAVIDACRRLAKPPDSSSPPRSPASAAARTPCSATTRANSPPTPTGPRRPRRSCSSLTQLAAASWTRSSSACPPSSSAPAARTKRPAASSARLCASPCSASS